MAAFLTALTLILRIPLRAGGTGAQPPQQSTIAHQKLYQNTLLNTSIVTPRHCPCGTHSSKSQGADPSNAQKSRQRFLHVNEWVTNTCCMLFVAVFIKLISSLQILKQILDSIYGSAESIKFRKVPFTLSYLRMQTQLMEAVRSLSLDLL